MIQLRKVPLTLVFAFAAALAGAQLTVPGTTGTGAGSDGVFAPTADVTIVLSLATDKAATKWDADNTANKGNGIYDREKWAVVFKYASVNIPAGVTVRFKGNRTNAPVVWLVQGDVTIEGVVNISGSGASSGRPAGGPGGFSGGFIDGSKGFGVGADVSGGGDYSGSSYGTGSLVYGNERIIPLIGGSGGGLVYPEYTPGGGGGAMLVGTPGRISLVGAIYATGYTTGSGGAVRLISNAMEGSGSISANARNVGRIRIESNSAPFLQSGSSVPGPSVDRPGAIAQIWPDATTPIVAITKVLAGTSTLDVPQDPNASFSFPFQDVSMTYDGEVTVVIETLNVPTDAANRWKVRLRVGPRKGDATWVDAALVSVNGAAAIWQVKFTFPAGVSALQARAFKG